MTAATKPDTAQALRRAAVRATLAPSVHNTQPWQFLLTGTGLELHADPTRQLQVLDPTRRQLVISCGCALFNARVSLATNGLRPVISRFPDPARPNLLARISLDGAGEESLDAGALDPELASIAALDAVVELRRTNRRHYSADPVPSALIDDLLVSASDEGASLFPIVQQQDRITLAVLSQRADRIQNADPAYRAELRAWTSDEPGRDDGVPAIAIPRGGDGHHDDVPIRDFDTTGAGSLPAETGSSMKQSLLLLGTPGDNPLAWLHAGEALERVLLEITRNGYAASLLTQVVEVPATRSLLRHGLGLRMSPHVLLRLGRAASTPATRRRRLVEVLLDVS
ncbi:MAG: hypothetical protein ABI140_00235 [Jatrophihabitantaceae bacterium]